MGRTPITTILIVEDGAGSAPSATETVGRLGYPVLSARACDAAVDAVKRDAAIGLVLMHPGAGRYQGFAAAAAGILAHRPLPIIFLLPQQSQGAEGRVQYDPRFDYIDTHSNDVVLRSAIEKALLFTELTEQARRSEAEFTADRKRLEKQLLQSQKLEGVGTLVGGIANDFNNLLAMILGSAELLRAQLAGQAESEKYVGRIIDAAERGASVSRQLLIFSRPDFADLKPISLSHTIAEMEVMLKRFLRKSIAIETTISLENGIIMGDAGQIQQALMNLALNADDAMGDTGTLTIKAATIAPAYFKKRFMFESAVPFIAVSVSDTGIGMEEAMIAQIFDPYFTKKNHGTGIGLGLSVVHGIVKNHNGFIDVESTPGIGSTFTLYFPTLPQIDDRAADQEPAPVNSGGESILVVDDEVLLRDTLREYLGAAGYRVSTATNGIEALEYFKVHYNTIDLVITDLGMPEMAGDELYRVLHKIDPQLKVVITTGYLEGTTRAQLFQMGVKDILTKPYRMREIKRIVRAVLDGA